MEKNFGPWFHHHPDRQSPNFYTLSSQVNLGQQNINCAPTRPSNNLVARDEILPGFPSSGAPYVRGSQTNETRGWFYCLPRFRQTFNSVHNSTSKTGTPVSPFANHQTSTTPNPKRFLVFDQSGDQTTVIYSSAIGTTPIQCLTSSGPKIHSTSDIHKVEHELRKDTVEYPGPILTNEGNSIQRDDVASEMHEDTEDIDAILYSSEDDEYSEDDEEASTGHSPSTLTANDKKKWLKEIGEEVASSAGPAKRIKLTDGGYDLPSVHDTASSGKLVKCFDYEDDAESSCADGRNKRSRKDKIRETVGILQNIVPGGKGKDAIVILEEAINYLKSLRCKAQDLGVHIL